jgi:septal ring factor EnvC (AmiA/AmiB activator)
MIERAIWVGRVVWKHRGWIGPVLALLFCVFLFLAIKQGQLIREQQAFERGQAQAAAERVELQQQADEHRQAREQLERDVEAKNAENQQLRAELLKGELRIERIRADEAKEIARYGKERDRTHVVTIPVDALHRDNCARLKAAGINTHGRCE